MIDRVEEGERRWVRSRGRDNVGWRKYKEDKKGAEEEGNEIGQGKGRRETGVRKSEEERME